MLSPSDTLIIFVVALLLFGPDQLPKIARQLGEFMRNVQNTTHNFMMEMDRAAEIPEVPVVENPMGGPADERMATSGDDEPGVDSGTRA